MIDVLCNKFGLQLHETPIGFKHICELMITDDDVLIGGDESGGIGIKGHIPERDGILSGLLLVELLATSEKSIVEIMAHLSQEIGSFNYGSVDLRYADEQLRTKLPYKLQNEISQVNGILSRP